MLEIVPVPAFSDNYIWLVHDAASGESAVVDPGDAAPALAEAERTQLLSYIEKFNARDFDGLRNLLADDVKLDL